MIIEENNGLYDLLEVLWGYIYGIDVSLSRKKRKFFKDIAGAIPKIKFQKVHKDEKFSKHYSGKIAVVRSEEIDSQFESRYLIADMWLCEILRPIGCFMNKNEIRLFTGGKRLVICYKDFVIKVPGYQALFWWLERFELSDLKASKWYKRMYWKFTNGIMENWREWKSYSKTKSRHLMKVYFGFGLLNISERAMNRGGFKLNKLTVETKLKEGSPGLRERMKHFDGHIFEDVDNFDFDGTKLRIIDSGSVGILEVIRDHGDEFMQIVLNTIEPFDS